MEIKHKNEIERQISLIIQRSGMTREKALEMLNSRLIIMNGIQRRDCPISGHMNGDERKNNCDKIR